MASGEKIKAEEKSNAPQGPTLYKLIVMTALGYVVLRHWWWKAKEPGPPFYGTPSSLHLKDALDTAFRLGDNVRGLWNMFLLASVAAAGWAVKGDLPQKQKFAVLGLYVVFCVVNGSNLFRMYRWLNAALADLQTEAGRYGGTGSKFWAEMRAVHSIGRPLVEGLVYAFVFFAVLFIVGYSLWYPATSVEIKIWFLGVGSASVQ